MNNLILGITGSVATTLTPKLYNGLITSGYNVKIVATTPALYFLPPNFQIKIYKDKDEWPQNGYHKNDPVEHIEFRTWADILLIAPITANTLAKIANGICDNFLTCIIRAWPTHKPLVLAPAMNTEMWTNTLTQHHINTIFKHYPKTSIISPVTKTLACGDTGIGAMANINDIINSFPLWSNKE
jgi:phosphopantothenoylcysteine decarboxylase